MPYRVRLTVYANDAALTESRIRSAIERGGGAIDSASASPTRQGSCELTFVLRIEHPQSLPEILDAVEGLPGVAVMRSSEPRYIKDLRSAQ